MIDPAQTALVLVIVVLTILLLVLGFQVFLILKEFRKTIFKTNKLLDDANVVSGNFSGSISSLSSITNGVKAGISLLNILKGKKKKSKHEEEE